MAIICLLFVSNFVLFSLLRKNKKSNLLATLLMCSISWFVVEIICYVLLVKLALAGGNFFLIGNQKVLDHIIKTKVVSAIYNGQKSTDSVYTLDTYTGWSLGNNRNYWKAPATNAQGFRAAKEYSLIPNANKFRVMTLGDSFIFGDGEQTPDTWPAMLEKDFNNIEVLNFGVSGYGLGQSYLRYVSQGLKFHPDVIFLNYLIPTHRDGVRGDIVLGGEPLTNANLYRVRFAVKDGHLTHEVTRPQDWFDPEFRRKYVFDPLGISEKDSFWSMPVFSISNLGLFLKQKLAGPAYAKMAKEAEYDNQIHFTILNDLLSMAAYNKTTVIFFFSLPEEILPLPIKTLLEKYKPWAVYFHATPHLMMRAKEKYNIEDRLELVNETAHFDARGNRVHADVLGQLLKTRPWGSGERIFQYHPDSNSFVNIQSLINR